MHTHVAEPLLEVRDARVQQKKALYVVYAFFIRNLYQHDSQLPPLPTHGVGAYSAVHGNTPIGNGHSSVIPDKGRPTFGIDLAEQMARDNVELPVILERCCAAIEKYGLHLQGIYRVSGMARKVASLRERLDKGLPFHALFGLLNLTTIPADMDSVDLDAEEWISDINNVTSVLKMWFRELPDPLLTLTLHQGFVEAASKQFMLQ
jgi:hypothetical protein